MIMFVLNIVFCSLTALCILPGLAQEKQKIPRKDVMMTALMMNSLEVHQ